MVDAIDGIGRGAEAREGEPYALPLKWPKHDEYWIEP